MLHTTIFHPDFAAHHRATVAGAAMARVVIERIQARGSFNFDTGKVDNVIASRYFEGYARIQKIARPTNRDFAEDQAKFQSMRVQLNYEANELVWPAGFTFEPNDIVIVTANPSNPFSVGERYYVHGFATGSNTWHQTLTCQTNMKQG